MSARAIPQDELVTPVCPLCSTPFSAGGYTADSCNHEAAWYREWLDISLSALLTISQGDGPDRERAQHALNAIAASVNLT